jgi:hypothetical protein
MNSTKFNNFILKKKKYLLLNNIITKINIYKIEH